MGVFRHFCQKRKRAVTTSLEWLQTSSSCRRRQLISANHMSMITSSGGRTVPWKTFRQCAFHINHKVKPAINIQISGNLGDAGCKPLNQCCSVFFTMTKNSSTTYVSPCLGYTIYIAFARSLIVNHAPNMFPHQQ